MAKKGAKTTPKKTDKQADYAKEVMAEFEFEEVFVSEDLQAFAKEKDAKLHEREAGKKYKHFKK